MKIPERYLHKLYSGWLGKLIGIRLGAPVEGWSYEKIKNVYGELTHYPIQYKDFAADDDSNGPLFFVRALEDCVDMKQFSEQDVADALLNYAPNEHAFFWWGGYGMSTEHTAYLNLKNGIKAPQSGSIRQNGHTVAEQIGGQIFIDCWGFVSPGNPKQAAELAKKAASVTHDGEGIYGGVFVAAAISLAFVETDIKEIIQKALQYIPDTCEYARVAKAVIAYHEKSPESFRDCFEFVHSNFGYDKYPGNCHIIPNAAAMILSMLYGNGNFEDTLNICNMCGWDTDCNAGNVGSIMGTLCELESIDYEKWVKPINDLLIASSVIGSLNIQDIPQSASYFAKLAYALAEEEIPSVYKTQIEGKSCHFEYKGSTHNIRVRSQSAFHLQNTDEEAFEGTRSLKVGICAAKSGEEHFIYKRTYYRPEHFSDSRYDPCFSPTVYPGQNFGMAVMPACFESEGAGTVQPYAKLGRSGEIIRGEQTELREKKWHEVGMAIPPSDDYIEEIGLILCGKMLGPTGSSLSVYLDNITVTGKPDYRIDFSNIEEENWNGFHREINQFTRLKGLTFLENGYLSLSSNDYAEMYTGALTFDDYKVKAELQPVVGDTHLINVRVQGAMRSYAAGFAGQKLVLMKNHNGYKVVAEMDFQWECGTEYVIECTAVKGEFTVQIGNQILKHKDAEFFCHGSIGISTQNGSRCRYKSIEVKGV